ncbi:MAG: hypothetical protein AB4426_25810 [Xenococcaceae cyanobacterium]
MSVFSNLDSISGSIQRQPVENNGEQSTQKTLIEAIHLSRDSNQKGTGNREQGTGGKSSGRFLYVALPNLVCSIDA